MINMLRSKPTWQHNNMTTIMTWHSYLLLELYNTAHGGIYIHIHMYIYKNIIPKHVRKTYTFARPVNREGYMAYILSTISHVASSGPKCFHYTLTCLISRFHSMSTFFYKIECGSSWNSPTCSTCNINQSITWSTYLTYLLSNDIWNIMEFHCGRKCKSIDHRSDLLNDPERSTKSRCHLCRWSNT